MKIAASSPKRTVSAQAVIEALTLKQKASERENLKRFYKGPTRGNKILGVKMGNVFGVAKQFADLSLTQVEKLLDSPYYEVRMAGVSIMDFQARRKNLEPSVRKKLFALYLKRHDRINNWDLVDRAAPHVVGGYLAERDRKPLQKLARAKDPWRRRTAIVSTFFFIRVGDIDETFKIAKILVNDKDAYVNKALGSWLREAGKRNAKMLTQFLERHSAKMDREAVGLASERLSKALRTKLLSRAR